MRTIVGIDSGRSCSLAILSLDGNLLVLRSWSNLSRSKLLDVILEYGTPMIVACDVSPPTKLAKKLASTFNAKLIYPSRSLSCSRKDKLVKSFAKEVKVRNDHERDALASAIYAFRKYGRLFSKIDRLVDSPLSEEVKKLIIRREVPNIKEGIRRVRREFV